MATKRDAVVEAQRDYDEVVSRSSGFTRSESQREAERKAYDRLKRVSDAAKKSGAGRGTAAASTYKRKARRD